MGGAPIRRRIQGMSAVFPAPITPADRERAEGYLKDAYADGLLGEAEFDTRMGQVMAAGSRSELTASCAGIVGVRPSVPRPRIAGGTGLAWCYIRAILAILLVILAIDLVVEGSKALAAQAKAKKAENA